MKQLVSVLIVAAAAVLAPVPASATTILTFGQSGSGDTIAGKNNGAGTTTISGTNVMIDITQIDAALGTPLAAYLTLTATSVAPATPFGLFVIQPYSGSFTITSGLGGTGTNYLSATFDDAIFGFGSSLTLNASSSPPETATFTSAVIADLGLPTGIAFSFADVSPAVHISKGSLGSFKSSVSGTDSATGPTRQHAPEPGSLALVGLAMLGLAGSLRRKSWR